MGTNIKRLPYGNSNFGSIMTENYAYVDKTRFIELLENESNKNQFFIRPRKFGKSLFYSMLYHYYDLNRADDFDTIFGDLYIGKHPTPKRNSYAVMQFNFSGLNTASREGFSDSLTASIRESVRMFTDCYRAYFHEADVLIRKIDEAKHGSEILQIAYGAAQSAKIKLLVLIDEYDHFANDLIAMGKYMGEEVYKSMVAANGLVRDFYETLKIGTSTVVDRIFITGISPVMLNDLTSGFNIADNLTLELQYNEMMGFTQEEVNALMIETGVDPACINVDMELYYNGYLFHRDGKNRVYNPSMILYFFNRILKEGRPPENIIDENLRTDYGRIRNLVQNERNREKLLKIVKDNGIESDIVRQFSIDRMYDDEYFVSLLVYMGLLTIDKFERGSLRLKIPNYSIQTLCWE
ncbi:MAG: AAA family ATPase, partial [Tannerella sp.]|nr:AAA family ATPase [Tannerella sp.]